MTIDIANRLVELRKKNGYSQEKLAELLGLSRQAVSKWERAEASPDTDNLILLSRLYGVSLDELLNTDESDDVFVGSGEAAEKAEEKQATDKKEPYVNIGGHGIHVEDGDDIVHVGWDGIHVTEKGKKKVQIGKDGIHVDDGDAVHVDRSGHVIVNGVEYGHGEWKKHFWYRFPFALIVLIAVVIISYINGSIYPTWMLLWLIPIVDSIFKAIVRRDIHEFSFPILMVAAFMFVGIFFGLWHPGWVLFLLIPVWYSLLPPRRRKKAEVDVDLNLHPQNEEAD